LPLLQRFARQLIEDGPEPSNWAPARLALEGSETEDPDNEDHLPIPKAVPRSAPKTGSSNPGKKQVPTSIRDWSDDDDDDDDCQILEPVNIIPISYAPPTYKNFHPAPAASRKRSGPGTSDAEASKTSETAAPKAKRAKKTLARRKKRGPVQEDA